MGAGLSAQVDGHELRIETIPSARLALILETIEAAKHRLALFYYIFAADAAGQTVMAALVDACARGVAVDLIIDGFGSEDTLDRFFRPLINAGGHVKRFNPHYGRRYLLRNHQKMLIADRQVALIGGCNISDDYFSAQNMPHTWYDLIIRIEGTAAQRLADYFDALMIWVIKPDAKVWQLRAILTDFSEATGAVRWLHGGLFRRLSPLTRALRYDIDHASRLHMVEAFFAPNWAMLRKLGHIVTRGGQCAIITAGVSNNTTTIAAARHCYHRLLSFNIEVREYVAHRLHMKLIIVDDAVYIGSANFDTRSLYINVELMIRIEDAIFAAKMRNWLTHIEPDTVAITVKKQTKRATLLNRLRWLVAFFIVSTLDYSVSRRLNIKDMNA